MKKAYSKPCIEYNSFELASQDEILSDTIPNPVLCEYEIKPVEFVHYDTPRHDDQQPPLK